MEWCVVEYEQMVEMIEKILMGYIDWDCDCVIVDITPRGHCMMAMTIVLLYTSVQYVRDFIIERVLMMSDERDEVNEDTYYTYFKVP